LGIHGVAAEVPHPTKDIDMESDFESRQWAENHQHVSASIGRLLSSIMQAFCVLHNIEWSAPWTVAKCLPRRK
jgi:hypothetical protein